jgi:DNA polymerase
MKAGAFISEDGDKATANSAAHYLPPHLSLKSLREASKTCEGCLLYRNATQTVFGKGPAHSPLMLVGEVPGDQEDIQGLPFVGPAGKLLDEALAAAGMARNEIYLTNAVKHFKWLARGKIRLHTKPSVREIKACRPWLEAEIEVVQPKTVVCLGATAAQTLMGRTFRLTQHLGELLSTPWAKYLLATFHPSAVLRAPEQADRQRMKEQLIHDLKVAVKSVA